MKSRCIPQVVFALSWLILCEADHMIGSGPSCLSASPADEGQTRVTFLREDAAGARSLFVSLWSEDARPVTCEVNADPLVAERYRISVCGTRGQEITRRFNVSALLAPDAPCALVSSGAPKFSGRTRRDETEGKARRKRAWIFPGTLWCGTGSRAAGYDQLGTFESTDRCCREHDHCLHVILAFTANYGVFNSNFFTVSHCDCDLRFRQCLLGANDTISRMVGYSFFDVLQVPCFELKQQRRCTERHLRGMCKVPKSAPYAVLQSPLPYSAVTSKYRDNNSDSNVLTTSERPHTTENFVVSPHRKSPKGEHRCSSRHPSKGCRRHRKLYTAAPSQMPPGSKVNTATPSVTVGLLNSSKSSALMPNKKKPVKKKNTRKGLSDPTRRSQDSPQAITNSTPAATSTAQSTPSLALEPRLTTAITAVTRTTKSPQKVPKQRHCEGCAEQITTVPPSTATYGLQVQVTAARTPRLIKTTESPKQDTWKRLHSAATSATAVTTNLTLAASSHEDGEPQRQMDFPLRWNSTRQEPSTIVQSTHAGRGLRRNFTLHNMTDNQFVCGSLKHLDECKYKIRPLGKKYDLQNTESKMAYHCDCTSRFAAQIEIFKQPSILPKLLIDFVSQYCFKLPKEKKCHHRKSCPEGFSKASDLLEALKMIEEKGTAGVRNTGNERRRGIPVRLYKRCLRLEREA